jgi:hypothetical protein
MTSVVDVSHLCLYNRPEFIALNAGDHQRYHRVDFHAEDRLVGTLAGVLEDDTFTSGFSAGFGGPDFSRERERLDLIVGMVDHAVEALGRMGVRRIVIRAKPQHYSASEAYLHFAFLRRRFSIEAVNLNFFLDIQDIQSADRYVQTLKSSSRKALRHALESGYSWIVANDELTWETAYSLLAENRLTQHGVSLSLSYDYIKRFRTVFPHSLALYILRSREEDIAAALIYTISRNRALVMYWGDRARKTQLSAMNAVAYQLVCMGLEEQLKTIDLGPCSTSDRVNFGNAMFKASIGGKPDMRYTFALNL